MGLLKRKPDSGDKIEKEITIVNRLGMHARPAAMFVRVASRFRCEVWVEKENEQINGKSIMGLMMLAASTGCSIEVSASGPQAVEALDALEALVANKFGEEA